MAHASTGLVTGQSHSDGASHVMGLQLVARAFAWVSEQRRINRTIATLSSLSDSTLTDIGINRSEIGNVARYGRRSIINRD